MRFRVELSRLSLGLVVTLCLLASPTFLYADNDVRKEVGVKIETPDGSRLATDIYLPSSGEQFPVILIRTPYGKGQMEVFAQFFVAHGYAVVVQDVRAKWSSDGEFIPFVNEQQDGLTTLDWIQQQSWSSGTIGMWGSSYLAFCALSLATTGHPSLKTVFNISGWLDEAKMISPGGALHWMLTLPWLLHESAQRSRSLKDYDVEKLFWFTPLKDVMPSIGIEGPLWENPDTLKSLDFDYTAIQIPIFHITGWYDFVYPSTLELYERASKVSSGFQKLMVGPWVHDQIWSPFTEAGDVDFGDESAMGIERVNELALRWFDRWLKGVNNGITKEPPVTLFVMGPNEWRSYQNWPPEGVTFERWFLSSKAGANGLSGDGGLGESLPLDTAPLDSFTFDPMDPVPTVGGANFHFFPDRLGIRDQRDVEQREDVLVYSSEPLTEDMLIVGPIEAKIYASTEALDTDFTAKLVEVHEDGYARNIVEGIVRGSCRNSIDSSEPMEPGRIYELTIDLGATALVIKRNHGLRLEISSSNFPKYDRNPNTEHRGTSVDGH
jgi:putative CocE/NonD family hydrolase